MKKYIVSVDGEKFEVVVQDADPNATYAPVPKATEAPKAEAPIAAPVSNSAPAGNGLKVTAPLPGSILKVLAKPGQSFKKGQTLCVLEAMKMENEIVAPQDCTVASVEVNEGATVNSGDLLFVMA